MIPNIEKNLILPIIDKETTDIIKIKESITLLKNKLPKTYINI